MVEHSLDQAIGENYDMSVAIGGNRWIKKKRLRRL